MQEGKKTRNERTRTETKRKRRRRWERNTYRYQKTLRSKSWVFVNYRCYNILEVEGQDEVDQCLSPSTSPSDYLAEGNIQKTTPCAFRKRMTGNFYRKDRNYRKLLTQTYVSPLLTSVEGGRGGICQYIVFRLEPYCVQNIHTGKSISRVLV